MIREKCLTDLLKTSYVEVWWTRLRPIRTAAEITSKIIIEPEIRIPLYQKVSQKVKELHTLGMSFSMIAKSLGIDGKTAIKAFKVGLDK